MPRNPTTVLALLLGSVLGFALAVSGGVQAERRLDRTDLPPEDARLLVEVLDRVKAEYVDRVDDHELMQHAIRGMLSGLDSHSAFLDEEELDDLRIATEGSYTGIGIEVSYEAGAIVVVSPIEGSPADRAGLRTGDVIVAIDDLRVNEKNLEKLLSLRKAEQNLRVHAFRRDELIQFEVEARAAPRDTCFLSATDDKAFARHRRAWLGTA